MPQHPLRVVVVDDADDVRGVLAAELRADARFELAGEGRTGHDAVDLAGRHRPEVLLLDVSMPEMDGLEALPAVLDASPATKVVMFTGFSPPGLLEQAVALGASAFIEKSISLDELGDRLAQVAAEGAAPPSSSQHAASPTDEPQAVLTEHLERFRAVFDRATIGMATTTLTAGIVRINDTLARLLGTTPDAVVGRTYVSLVAPEGRDEFLDAMYDVVTAKRDSVDVEHAFVDASRMWVRSTIAAVRDSGDRPLYLFLQVEDLTGRRHAIEALHESEERFRLLVESVVDYAIFMLDTDGYIVSWNAGAERIKGYRAEEILGRHYRTFYPAEAQASGYPERQLVMAKEKGVHHAEGWRVRKDGSRFWANVVITALFDATGTHVGFAKVTRDFTEQRAVAAARDAAAAELADANQKLRVSAQEKSDFLGVTAHELRGPILALTGAAHLLRTQGDALDAADRDELYDTIDTSAARLRRLLDDLILTSRLEADAIDYELEILSVREIVEHAARAVARDADIRFDGSYEVTARADRVRLEQIVTNLVQNALAHGAPPVELSVSADDGMAELRVTDHGAGVTDQLVPQLFVKFGRGNRRSDRGTGLGLYIVRELALAQGGDVRYEPTPGGGATFVVRLPLA